MKACQYKKVGSSEVLEIVTVPQPVRGKGEVIIQIVAAGLNPLDVKVWKGQFFPFTQRLPKIPGSDVAGVVVEVGPGSKFKKGDRAFGFLDSGFPFIKRGTHAEYIAAPEKQLAHIPAGVSFADAAAVTAVVQTAWQGLDVDKLKAGQRILIHAGAGGVGHVAIQLAKLSGLYVITTASTRNHQFVKDLGADECIDYKHADFVQQLKHNPVDLVFESVGGVVQLRFDSLTLRGQVWCTKCKSDYTARSLKVLKKSGRHIHIFTCNYARYGHGFYVAILLEMRDVIIGVIKGLLGLGPKFQPVGAEQDPKVQARAADLMAAGKLKVHIDKTFPLEQARAAHEYQDTGNPRGKIVIKVKD